MIYIFVILILYVNEEIDKRICSGIVGLNDILKSNKKYKLNKHFPCDGKT